MGLSGPILLAFLLGLPANEIVLPILLMFYSQSGMLVEGAARQGQCWRQTAGLGRRLSVPFVFLNHFLRYHTANHPQGNGQLQMDGDFLPAANDHWDLSVCRCSRFVLFLWFDLIFGKMCYTEYLKRNKRRRWQK